jgi:hypothetical protein
MTSSHSEDLWWQQPLIRHLAAVLVVKLALIYGMWWMFFDLPDDHEISTGQVATHLAGEVESQVPTESETKK